jgi:hypothetical protein
MKSLYIAVFLGMLLIFQTVSCDELIDEIKSVGRKMMENSLACLGKPNKKACLYAAAEDADSRSSALQKQYSYRH